MSITTNSRTIAEETSAIAQLRPVIGAYELVLMISGTTHATQEVPRWFRIHGARASARSTLGVRDLGQAMLRIPTVVRQQQYGGRFAFELIIMLQPVQLMALEDHRNAGNLDFEVVVTGIGGAGDVPNDYNEDQTLRMHVAESAWVAQLASAKALDILLLEVPMPMAGASDTQKKLFDHMKTAHGLFIDGHYTACITECRKALEELGEGTSTSWAMLADRSSREAMTKSERLRGILATVQHYAHLSAHSASRGGIEDYARSDARLVMVLVAACIAHEAMERSVPQ